MISYSYLVVVFVVVVVEIVWRSAALMTRLLGPGIPSVALRVCFFHSGVPQEGHRVNRIGSGLPFSLAVASTVTGFKRGVILQRHSVLNAELVLPGAP
jgi:hypothetical protein